ncbi:hypothetical protein LCGC14_2819590, partial [marine sediment metagenome]
GQVIVTGSDFLVDTDTLYVDSTTSRVGIGLNDPAQKFEIGSNDGTDRISIYHDNTNANIKWNDGTLRFQTDEGTNTTTSVEIRGKGSSGGQLNVYNPTASGSIIFFPSLTLGHLRVSSALSELALQNIAIVPITMFRSATNNETQELQIYGFRDGDSKRSLQIGVGVDAADTASFDGVSNYYFDGNVGIGTTSPHQLLDVDGIAQFHQPAAADAGMFISQGATSVSPTREWQLKLNTANDFIIRDNSGGANRIVIDTTGDVGIGTDSPSQLLHINEGNIRWEGNGTETLWFGNSQNAGLVIRANIVTTLNSGTTLRYNIDSDDSSTTAKHIFGKDQNDDGAGNELMVIQENGNVGIGTTSPGQKLSVNGVIESFGAILPDADSTRNLGSSSRFWSNLFIDNIV